MSQAVARCLRRRLGLVGPDEIASRLLGGFVSCVVVLICSTVLYYAVLARFFGRAARQGQISSDMADSMFNPYIVFGLALFFIVGLPITAWYEGMDDPDKADRAAGCSALATVYLGGSILKAVRALVPRKSPLTHAQFQLATALLAHLLERSQAVDADELAKGILAGNPRLTQLDFDRAMVELRDRNMISADAGLKLDSRFKAEIRHAQG